jgi:serine/threonine protein kinase
MAIDFRCACGATFTVPDHKAGVFGPCPFCGDTVQAPGPDSSDTTRRIAPTIDVPGYQLLGELVRKPLRGKIYEATGPGGVCSVRVVPVLGYVHRKRLDEVGAKLQAVTHPALLRLLSWGDTHFVTEHAYFAEELLPWPNLRRHVALGTLDEQVAARHAWTIAGLLDELERERVPYRLPLAPENVIVNEAEIRLTELEPPSWDWSTRPDTWASATSPDQPPFDFMAPELLDGGHRDERTAVHAVGSLLHFMLSGRAPFEGKSSGDSMLKVLVGEAPKPGSGIVADIAERCLKRDPEKRYRSLKELADVIGFLVLGLVERTGMVTDVPPPNTPPPEPPPPRPTCTVCHKEIPAEDEPFALPRKGLWVCPFCRGPRISIPRVRLGRCIGDEPWGVIFEAVRDDGLACTAAVMGWLGALDAESERLLHAAGKIEHPNVARLRGFGITGQNLWTVHDALTPDTLKRRVERSGPLPAAEAAAVARGVALGLEALFDGEAPLPSLVPENVLLEREGPKVALFVAVRQRPDIRDARFGDPHGPGIAFRSPEQIGGDSRLQATAVYGVGALLYFMLTGKKPFAAKSNMDFFMKILHEPPEPIGRPDVPAALNELVARCLAKKPEERFQTLKELAAALSSFTGT